jgi:radical SAM protein with 4Fe4S-binding SPASM domain
MSSLLSKAAWRLYHTVHTVGFLADAVYAGAFYAEKLQRRFLYWRARHRAVQLEDLQPLRHLEPSTGFTTGVTNICNAKCTFCAYPKVMANKTLQTGIMSLEIFKKSVDEWAAAGGQDLDLTPVVGDPLVDPGLMEKLDYAVRRARIKNVVLTTNAILLTRDDNYKRLIDLGIAAVFISTEGMDKATYERVYGVKQYEAMLSGVRHLLEYNRQKGEPARVVVRFRNAQKPSRIIHSKDFREAILPYLSERVRINFTVDFDNWGGTIQAKDLQGNMRMRKLPPQLDVPCQRLFPLAVRHEGSVRVCACRLTRSDLDDLVVGNIQKDSLETIAGSEAAWQIVKNFYAGKRPETCRQCTFYRPVDQVWLQARLRSRQQGAAPAAEAQLPAGAGTGSMR